MNHDLNNLVKFFSKGNCFIQKKRAQFYPMHSFLSKCKHQSVKAPFG